MSCQRPSYQDGEFAIGQNRHDGSEDKEEFLQNSAFEDPDTSKVLPQSSAGDGPTDFSLTNPDAPASDIPVRRLCSDHYAGLAGGHLLQANTGVQVALHPVEEQTENKKVVFADPTESVRMLEAIVNTGYFALPLGNVPYGVYQLLLCDRASPSSCDHPLLGDEAPYQFATRPGLLATAFIQIERGRMQLVKSPIDGGETVDVLVNRRYQAGLPAFSPHQPAPATPLSTDPFSSLGLRPSEVQSEQLWQCDAVSAVLMIDGDNLGIDLLAPFGDTTFDMDGNGSTNHVSWPRRAGSYFLAIDLNGNDKIDSGRELIGSNTAGLIHMDGFVALRTYDDNRDGKLNRQDPAYERFVLWSDANGNGESETSELIKLADAKLASIDLQDVEASEKDRWGNHTDRRSVAVVAGKKRMILNLRLRRLD